MDLIESESISVKVSNEILSHTRFIVARHPNAGIGDHLSCLVGAWWFAKRTGRVLIIDWRGSRFCSDPSTEHNCFTDFFGQYDSIDGVKVICDHTVSNISYSGPFFPAKWNLRNIRDTSHVKHTQSEIDDINRLVTSSEDRPEPTVAFNQWIHPGPPKDEVRSLLRTLKFSDAINAAADRVWKRSCREGSGLAIHVRHGNGENIGARAAYWLDPWRFFQQLRLNSSLDIHRAGVHGRFSDNMPESLIRSTDIFGSEERFLKRVKRVVRSVQKCTPNLTPILFCDSRAVADKFAEIMPGTVVLDKIFLNPNAGPLHSLPSDNNQTSRTRQEAIYFEMAVEMELMRRCSALVCMDSGFSILSKAIIDDRNIKILKPTLINRIIERLFNKALRRVTSSF